MPLVYRAPQLNSTESGGHGINGRGNGVNAGCPQRDSKLFAKVLIAHGAFRFKVPWRLPEKPPFTLIRRLAVGRVHGEEYDVETLGFVTSQRRIWNSTSSSKCKTCLSFAFFSPSTLKSAWGIG